MKIPSKQTKKTYKKPQRSSSQKFKRLLFDQRLFPDYFQSYGLGFYEYFRLAEEIGAEPLPVVSVGLACQYQSQHHQPVDQLQPYIDDALDLIAFANGDPATNKWAKIRAEMGHPAPFYTLLLVVFICADKP